MPVSPESETKSLTSIVTSPSVALALRLERKTQALSRRIKSAEERISGLQSARLLSGGVFALALLLAAIQPGWKIPGPAALVFAPVFAVLVARTRAFARFLVKLKRLRDFNNRQIARLRGQNPELPHLPFQHETYGSDLDFFGQHSLWTLLDETITDEGSAELRRWIVEPPQAREALVHRQNRIKLLRPEAWFYTRLGLIADRAELKASSQQVLEFLDKAALPKWVPTMWILSLVLWVAWLAAMIGIPQDTPAAVLKSILFIAFAFVHLGLALNLGAVFKQGVGVSHHLSLITPLFGALEKRAQERPHLRALCPTTAESGPARVAKSLNFAVGLLGTTANPILHLLINAVLPFTSSAALMLERQRKKLSASFGVSLRELAHLEALLSLVIFDRYQTQTYPVLDSEHIRARDLFHPLVARDKVVANDFEFKSGKSLGLLTGSNMSGKSTFLRTIGLNQALANIGAPVFASEFHTQPLLIESCIEVSDSLRDGFSYFYAEVRRLKSLLDSAKNGRVLYLIDEIFRGTNNRERQIGSRAVIQALAQTPGSQGFISTHDLELTSLEEVLPRVVNLHFREHIVEGRMAFTYRLQLGASPTTNALRIMQIEGLPVDDVV